MIRSKADKPIHYAHHPRCILSYTGMLLQLGGLLLLTPLSVLVIWPEEYVLATGFLVPSFFLVTAGTIFRRYLGVRVPSAMSMQEGSVIVVLNWGIVCIASAVPFMMIENLDFTQALFESVSGWTTTGLSVMDVTRTSHLCLLWRSIMQLAGGAGLAIIMLASITGPVGTGMSRAEGRNEQLVPHIRASVRLVMWLYSSYATLGILAYLAAGMTPFDSVNHAFTAVATGGFSTHPSSIAHWNSIAIEAITIPLMIMGNVNFLTAYALVQGKVRAVLRNGEIRLLMFLIPVCALAIFMLVTVNVYPTMNEAIRIAIFEPVSALTGTGFTITGYAEWGGVGLLILIALMIIGGGSGSTAGGIKQYRIYLMVMSIWWQIRRLFMPRTAVVHNYVWRGENKEYISHENMARVGSFVFLYIAIWFIGGTIIASCGYPIRDALFEFASALGTVGLSVGVTLPDAPRVVLWTETVGMFLGRLEFFVVVVGLQKLIMDMGSMMFRRRQ